MHDIAEPGQLPKKKAGRKRPGETRRAVAVVIKGTPEWKAWVEELAKHCRLSVSTLGDLAIAAYAKGQGFMKKPPER